MYFIFVSISAVFYVVAAGVDSQGVGCSFGELEISIKTGAVLTGSNSSVTSQPLPERK